MRSGMSQWLRRAVAARGPVVRCEACGGALFRGLPVVSRGQVKLLGADDALVRVDFATTSRLGFRHVDLSDCRRGAPHRPA